MQDVGSVRRGEAKKVDLAPHTVPSVNCLRPELTENAKQGVKGPLSLFFFFLT